MYKKYLKLDKSFFYRYFLLVLIPLSSIECTAQLLTFDVVNAKIPYPYSCSKPFYDGGDKVYLLGGCLVQPENSVWLYSLSTDTIQRVGITPERSGSGTLQGDAFGNIFYLGGGDDSNGVYKLDLVANTTTLVAQFPSPFINSVSIKANHTGNIVYIFGGFDQSLDVSEFDLQFLNYSKVASVGYNVQGGASVRLKDKAYIFAYAGMGAALEFDLNTLQMQRVGTSSMPKFKFFPSAALAGNFVYILGGYYDGATPSDGIIQFDITTFESNFLPVENFPIKFPKYFDIAPASVFVPSLNRIYYFGGRSDSKGGLTWHNDIFYLDLTQVDPITTTTERGLPTRSTTTLNPDLFYCSNCTDGFYPHPKDCSMYIECQDKEMTFFKCPPPLLYDSLLGVCNFPDEVVAEECGISRVDNPDGNYPHPQDL